MSGEFSVAYRQGRLFSGDGWLPAGYIGVSALNIPRETIAELEVYYKAGDSESMLRTLRGLECVRLTASLTVGEASGAVDDIVCFRVYIRYFLAKYFVDGRSDADALHAFLGDLDGLVRQLRREENPRRTVMPVCCASEACFGTDGGEVCERIVFPTLGELLIYDVKRAVEWERAPRSCPACGRYFVPERRNTHYCGAICRETGVRRAYADRTAQSEARKLFARACGRVYTRKNRGRITSEEAAAAIARCVELRDRAIDGELTAEALATALAAATTIGE